MWSNTHVSWITRHNEMKCIFDEFTFMHGNVIKQAYTLRVLCIQDTHYNNKSEQYIVFLIEDVGGSEKSRLLSGSCQ